MKQRVEFEDMGDNDDNIECFALQEGFFGARTMKEKWHKHWKVTDENKQAPQKNPNDIEMPDIESAAVLLKLEEVSDVGDPMETEYLENLEI